MKNLKWLLTATCLCILTCSLAAEETQFEPAGSRAFTQEEQAEITQNRDKDKPDTTDEDEVKALPIYNTTHPAAFHSVYKLINYNSKVELNDGSIWDVCSADSWKLSGWYSTDSILVLPNHSLFSYHRYVLVNVRNGDRVDVNLAEMEVLPYDPSFFGQRYWIISIDYISNIVTLNDGSLWSVSFSDDTILNRWFIGEVVFIGNNDHWDQTYNPNILIHFNTMQYVRASCF